MKARESCDSYSGAGDLALPLGSPLEIIELLVSQHSSDDRPSGTAIDVFFEDGVTVVTYPYADVAVVCDG